MKQTINQFQFHDVFNAIRPNNFTYEGLTALYDWLEEYEESTGDEVELDVIALCCEFTEYGNMTSFHADYDEEEYPDIETISDNTTVIMVGEGFIIGEF